MAVEVWRAIVIGEAGAVIGILLLIGRHYWQRRHRANEPASRWRAAVAWSIAGLMAMLLAGHVERFVELHDVGWRLVAGTLFYTVLLYSLINLIRATVIEEGVVGHTL